MDYFVISNMLNGGLVVIVGFLLKNWMNGVGTKIDGLTLQVRTQNGNVARVTEEIHLQVKECKLRNEGRRISDRCD